MFPEGREIFERRNESIPVPKDDLERSNEAFKEQGVWPAKGAEISMENASQKREVVAIASTLIITTMLDPNAPWGSFKRGKMKKYAFK